MPHFLNPAEAEAWVFAGLLIFLGIVIFVAKAPKAINAALDAKSAKIQGDLDEAARIREEAQRLLTQLKAERAEAEAQAKAEEEAARDAERQRFCEQARNQLGALQSGQRVSRFNAAGEREFLDDAARSTEIARLQQQVAEHCQ